MSEVSTAPATDNAGTVEVAASAMLGILSGADNAEQPEETNEDLPNSEIEAEAEEVETAIDGDDEPIEDDQPAENDDSEDEPAQTRKYTVKIDGKSVEVDESELIKGYQREADYTRKTQAVAEERKAIEAYKAEVAAERQRYADGVNQITAFLQSTAPKPPGADLLEQDPVEYLKQQRAFEDHMTRLQAARAEQSNLAKKAGEENSQKFQSMVKEQYGLAIDAIPEWKDEAKANSEKKAIAEYLINSGKYSQEEVGSLVDHRALVIARKAFLYDSLMQKKAGIEKKVADAPKFQKPGTTKTVKTQGQQRFEAKFNRLRGSGRVEDAAAVFRDLL
jgi:hypothetical protein